MSQNVCRVHLALALLVLLLPAGPVMGQGSPRVRVDSEPAGELYVNGALIGRTPLELALRPSAVVLETGPRAMSPGVWRGRGRISRRPA